MVLIETLGSKLGRIACEKQSRMRGVSVDEVLSVQDQVLRACRAAARSRASEGVRSVEVCLGEEAAEFPRCLKYVDYSWIAATLRREGFTVYSCGYVRGGLSGSRGNGASVQFSF